MKSHRIVIIKADAVKRLGLPTLEEDGTYRSSFFHYDEGQSVALGPVLAIKISPEGRLISAVRYSMIKDVPIDLHDEDVYFEEFPHLQQEV